MSVLSFDAVRLPSASTRDVEILLVGAEHLRDADWFPAGKSDPYAVCRLGPVGSSWSDKAKATEHKSKVVLNSLSPNWQLAFRASVPSESWEVQVRVFDQDDLIADDFLGEVCVLISVLERNGEAGSKHGLSTKEGKPCAGQVELVCTPAAGAEYAAPAAQAAAPPVSPLEGSAAEAGDTEIRTQALLTLAADAFTDMLDLRTGVSYAHDASPNCQPPPMPGLATRACLCPALFPPAAIRRP